MVKFNVLIHVRALSKCTICKYCGFSVQFKYVQFKKGLSMPQIPTEANDRMSLRIASEEKLLLMRAAALQHTNLTEFVIRNIVPLARKIIDEKKHLELSERDSLRILDLLDNPPAPNKKLMAAAFALPEQS